MLKYKIGALSPASMEKLAELQKKVDVQPTHRERYELASKLFKNKSNPHFDEVRATLKAVAPGGDACYYCERDRYREIEHIRPKRHYPEHCFDWFNYVYACTICNQDKKKDTFAVFDGNGEIIVLSRDWEIGANPTPLGQQVLIDLRTEDPLEFLQLDFATGIFEPIGDDMAKKRGCWTCNLFALNNDDLTRFRRKAYKSYLNYLERYQQALACADLPLSELVLDEIRELSHPTVLVEMRRQAIYSPQLQALFLGVPVGFGALT